MSFELDQSQLAAVKFASEGRFSIINGGAGCGKTTIIKEVVGALNSARQPYSLCAPTGKAAARLKEATGIHASTVHSLLGYDGAVYNEPPFPDKTIIIDESSMLDSCLLAEVVKRAPRRLILVGDQAQLTPVGAGQPFHDIIEYYPDRVRTLTTCYRATEAVFKASSAIRRGEMPLLHDKSDNEVWDVYDSGEAETTQQVILEWVKKGVFNFETDIILAPKNGERNKETGLFPACTVNRLNEEIIKIVNPREERDTRKFLTGDRVINTKNNPDKDIWNGTTGTVHGIDIDGGMWLKLDIPVIDPTRTGENGEPVYKDRVLLSRDEQLNLSHAYALTVHKSQGSQYRQVCFVCLMRDRFVLNRALTYTAVTRTKQRCIVAGQVSALAQSMQHEKSKQTVIQLIAGKR